MTITHRVTKLVAVVADIAAYYIDSVKNFLSKDSFAILGEITSNDQFSAEDLQKNTWKKEIEILKREFKSFLDGCVLFEYAIPRVGDRIDFWLMYRCTDWV